MEARQHLENSDFGPLGSAPRPKALRVQTLGDFGKRSFFSNQLQHQGQNRSFRRILLQVLAIVCHPKAVRSANLDSGGLWFVAADLPLPFDHNGFPAFANSLLQVILSDRPRQSVTSMVDVSHGLFLGAIIEIRRGGIRHSGLEVRGTKSASRNAPPSSRRGVLRRSRSRGGWSLVPSTNPAIRQRSNHPRAGGASAPLLVQGGEFQISNVHIPVSRDHSYYNR